MDPRTCVVCGAGYRPRRATQKACSPLCMTALRRERQARDLRARRAGPRPKPCVACGREFVPDSPARQTCSVPCRNLDRARKRRDYEAGRRARRHPRPCVVCGREFAPDRRTALVCPDPGCRARHKRDLAASLNRGRAPEGAEGRVCVVCGADFVGHHNSLVCSRECRLDRQRELSRRRLGFEPPRCLACGRVMDEVRDYREHRYTCSEVCRELTLRRRRRRIYRRPGRRERMAEQVRRRKAADPEFARLLAERDRQGRRRARARLQREEIDRLARSLADRLPTPPRAEDTYES